MMETMITPDKMLLGTPFWCESPGNGRFIRAYCADSLELLFSMPDNSVDVTITDPPYNVNFQKRHWDSIPDYENWCRTWFEEVKRVTRCAIGITCGHPNLCMWMHIEKPVWTLCWFKPNSAKTTFLGFCNWDPILLYGKTEGRRWNDVIRAPIIPDPSLDAHATPKPLEWARKQARMFCKEGGVIFDPFMGSGTTGVAAILDDFNYIGCDSDESSFAMSIQRFERAIGVKQYALPCMNDAEDDQDSLEF